MSVFRNNIVDKSSYAILYISFGLILFMLIAITIIITKNSMGTLSFNFIFDYPRNGMTEGGIFPIILGTCLVTLLSAIASIPIGIAGAIYLNEYAKESLYTKIIKLSIRNLAAVPSIVYGLFGLAIFVKTLRFGTSVFSAGLTLGLLTLPTIISVSQEALKNVPDSYRSGALALGLTKWQTLRTNVIPVAIPGIITGIILGISRALGETAPILFTGAAFFLPKVSLNIFDQFMALPYHLYIMSTQHHDIEGVRGIAYATAAVLVIITVLLNIVASTIRFKYRNTHKN